MRNYVSFFDEKNVGKLTKGAFENASSEFLESLLRSDVFFPIQKKY